MRKTIKIVMALALILGVFYFYIMQDFEKAPATLFTNGNILTLNEVKPKAQALYVKDGQIVAIGTEEALNRQFPDPELRVDLKGATVMPGFIDPHSHFSISLFMSQMHDLSGFTYPTNLEVRSALVDVVAQTPDTEWILGKGIDPVLTRDLVPPSLDYLDSLAPNNPVLLFSQSLHSYWANSAAFKAVGIDKNTPNPSISSYYAKDTLGNLNGLIVEQVAIKPFLDHIKKHIITPDRLSIAASQVMLDYAKNGNTTVVSAGITIQDKNPLLLFRHLSTNQPSFLGKLLERIGMLPKRKPLPRHFLYMRHDMAHLLPEKKGEPNDFYDIIGIKHWYDGSPYTGSMYLREPYLNTDFTREVMQLPENYSGIPLIPKEELQDFIRKYHENGWQIAFHVQGDAATQEVIDAFANLESELSFSDRRHRLEHNLLLPSEAANRIKKLGLTPSFHINHLLYYGDALEDELLGTVRAQAILPVKTIKDAGIPFSLHADQPMFESNPFRLIQTAVERKTTSGRILGAAEKIKVLEALKAMTINAAWQIHKEDQIGTLEPGKYADFIVLDKNPLEVSTNQLGQIKCLQTYVNGNLIK